MARTDDPAVVLAHAATIGPATERAVRTQLGRLDAELVAAARLAPGVHGAFARLAAAGTRLTVIGRLAPEPIRAFLVMHGLDEYVRCLADPDSIAIAIREIALKDCLFVGSTKSDLAAARAAGVDSVRYELPAESWFAAVGQV